MVHLLLRPVDTLLPQTLARSPLPHLQLQPRHKVPARRGTADERRRRRASGGAEYTITTRARRRESGMERASAAGTGRAAGV